MLNHNGNVKTDFPTNIIPKCLKLLKVRYPLYKKLFVRDLSDEIKTNVVNGGIGSKLI